MAARRVSIAALLFSVGGILAMSPAADADAPATDAPPVTTADPPATDATSDLAPGQEVPIGVAADAYADTDPSALTDFRGILDPYGSWVDDPNYGTVWAPSPNETGDDFAPYVTAGHWAYDGDYVWVSDYPWGWVAFHYGRWQRIVERGWVWIPGRLYAAAWVVWRLGTDGYDYIGWAPMAPAWAWRGGIAVGVALAAWEPFVFCPPGDLFASAIATRVVAGEAAAVVAPHTRPYVRATPVVAAHPLAQSMMHGPPAASLGIDASHVVRLTGAERGLVRAQQYARPSTAQALGARQPVPHFVRPRPIMVLPYTTRPATRAPRRR
jgi:hypothetical protein